jgi:hypothetical protein
MYGPKYSFENRISGMRDLGDVGFTVHAKKLHKE